MELITAATFIFVSIITILLVYDYYIHNNRRGKYISKIPGPKSYPIIGNALDVMVPLEDIWHFFRRIGRDHYPVSKFWIVNWPVVNVHHPDDVEIILSSTKNIEKNIFYELLHPWLKEGLLTSKGDKWRSRRKILTPAFHFNILQEFSQTLIEQTKNLIETLQSESKSGEVVKELLPILSKFTLNTICAMGVTVDKKSTDQDNYRKSIYEIGLIFYYRAVRPWLKNEWIFSLTKKGKENIKILKTLHNFTSKIIGERKKYHKETKGIYLNEFTNKIDGNKDTEDIEDKNSKKRLAFLDLLIAASEKNHVIDDEGIREEVDTFVFEGHDTTAMALFFTILLLAEHTDIQTIARQEVDEILNETNGQLTYSAIQKVSYLERCIKESLRMYPSVPIIGRNITEDIKLKHCFVPAGSILNIQIFDTHRDPNFWERPNIYDPDRFLPNNTKNRHPFSYVPFSAGPRNCIGQKFAMLELKTVLAGLLHNFKFEAMESAANIRILPDLVIRCAHPVNVKFIPIKK
ncbi:cytochrome P450 4C1-like isoform X2 [Aphidius gifuensis]|uniref:cytochrome P450 4C1-like isoform X2 n=1 Tax=Aphidius gifuensis TaxID=684658 RepID=UPI001CDBB89C|nr:cytochrome P450 4C1-like isoform X2 [Aphidius gifuensis]